MNKAVVERSRIDVRVKLLAQKLTSAIRIMSPACQMADIVYGLLDMN